MGSSGAPHLLGGCKAGALPPRQPTVPLPAALSICHRCSPYCGVCAGGAEPADGAPGPRVWRVAARAGARGGGAPQAGQGQRSAAAEDGGTAPQAAGGAAEEDRGGGGGAEAPEGAGGATEQGGGSGSCRREGPGWRQRRRPRPAARDRARGGCNAQQQAWHQRWRQRTRAAGVGDDWERRGRGRRGSGHAAQSRCPAAARRALPPALGGAGAGGLLLQL